MISYYSNSFVRWHEKIRCILRRFALSSPEYCMVQELRLYFVRKNEEGTYICEEAENSMDFRPRDICPGQIRPVFSMGRKYFRPSRNSARELLVACSARSSRKNIFLSRIVFHHHTLEYLHVSSNPGESIPLLFLLYMISST